MIPVPQISNIITLLAVMYSEYQARALYHSSGLRSLANSMNHGLRQEMVLHKDFIMRIITLFSVLLIAGIACQDDPADDTSVFDCTIIPDSYPELGSFESVIIVDSDIGPDRMEREFNSLVGLVSTNNRFGIGVSDIVDPFRELTIGLPQVFEGDYNFPDSSAFLAYSVSSSPGAANFAQTGSLSYKTTGEDSGCIAYGDFASMLLRGDFVDMTIFSGQWVAIIDF